ncbi:MAG: DUF523 domain-containing protein [Clostridia bacterium]|nr:DUF523 domain-containing protein [Clostridia bacterium]
MKKILVSACLLGDACRYDGKSKPSPAVIALRKKYELIPVCPEVMGGLPTPRMPSEICGTRVVMKDGTDVTQNYEAGAQIALRMAREHGCTVAVLKERSPSCGSGLIHNGLFDGGMTDGDGITARLLKANGIRVLGESEITSLLED